MDVEAQKLSSESGLELIARLIERPSFQHIDNVLFPNGLRNTDIVEISGNVSSGKTKLLTQLIAKCILPVKYCGMNVNGLNASVLLINTDNHFKVSYLLEVMRHFIYKTYEVNGVRRNLSHEKYIDYHLNRCLEGLIIINCYMSKQFILTLQSLDNILIENQKIAMVAIDGITPFYWFERDVERTITYDMYTKKLLEMLKKNIQRFNVVTMYTKSSDFVTKTQTVAGKYIMKSVNYKIKLQRNDESNSIICCVHSGNNKSQLNFEINKSSIRWLKLQSTDVNRQKKVEENDSSDKSDIS